MGFGNEVHDRILAALDLRYGATRVWIVRGVLFGSGDDAHCPVEDIRHNLIRLAEMLSRCDTKSATLSKAYDSDTYIHGRIDRSLLPPEGCWLSISQCDPDAMTQDAKWYGNTLYRIVRTGTGWQLTPIPVDSRIETHPQPSALLQPVEQPQLNLF